MKSAKNTPHSDVRVNSDIRDEAEYCFIPPHPRSADDPMRLSLRVQKRLKHYFLKRNLTWLSGLREMMNGAIEAILQACPGSVTAIPFQPGLGKSTLIRALLEECSEEFGNQTPIAQRIGGIIVVVEKTAEAEELAQLCNQHSEGHPIARAISSVNDYNLSQGKCINERATSYEECLKRSCPDYNECPLIQAAHQTHDTPILVILHARYQRHMEDMSSFLTWEDSDGQPHSRTLLLVDELPPLIEENALDISALNKIESRLSEFKPSYLTQFRSKKLSVLYEWNRSIRTPFFKLIRSIQNGSGLYGIISLENLGNTGLSKDKLQSLRKKVMEYIGASNHEAISLIDTLLDHGSGYYAIGQDITLFFPKLCKLHGEGQPATFIFSGTTSLSPELSQNPDIHVLPEQPLESFQRLQINIQRGDLFNSSKTGLARKQNIAAVIEWLRFKLPILSERHPRILAVTYKQYAEIIWNSLSEYQDTLIPYIASDGQPKPFLPYFGGLNGSNLYRKSTCVVCLGLNRFEPRDYISRALALDFDGSYRSEIQAAMKSSQPFQLDCSPCTLKMQDITLARDLVQLVFRSALRNHGESQPIEVWLLQPPNDMVQHLQSFFTGCQIYEHADLPEACRFAAVSNREYNGNLTHAAKLMQYLQNLDENVLFTPEEIRACTGLSRNQFKEAKKHPDVKGYFQSHIQVFGSGKNTNYMKHNIKHTA